MPDLSQLSQSDIEAIKSRNLTALSDEGRQIAESFLSESPEPTQPTQPMQSTEPSQQAAPAEDAMQEEASAAERFAYGFASTKSDVQLAFRAAQVNLGLGEFKMGANGLEYRSQEEAFGEEFANAPSELKAAVLQRLDENELAREFPELSQQEGIGGLSGFGGSLAGALMSPTSLFGGGVLARSGMKGIAALGAGFGAEYNALEQLAQTATINPKELAVATTIGAVAAPATTKAFSLLGAGVKKGLLTKSVPRKVDEANKTMMEVQRVVLEERLRTPARGAAKTFDEIFPKIQARLGLTREQVDEFQALSTLEIQMPKTKKAATDALTELNGEIDAVSASGSLMFRNVLASASTEIAKISPRVGGWLRRYDSEMQVNTAKYMKRVEPFLKAAEKIPPKIMEQAHRHFLANDLQAAKTLLKPHSDTIGATIDDAALVLRELLGELQEAGYKVSNNMDYWPRRVISYEELLAQTNRQDKSKITRMVEARAKTLKTSVEDLPQDELDDVISRFYEVRNRTDMGSPSSAIKSRKMNVDEATSHLYHMPQTALAQHVRSTVQRIQKAKFLGRKNVSQAKGAQNLDFGKSLNKLLGEELQFKSMNPRDSGRLRELLDARFGLAEKTGSSLSNKARTAMHMATIANPISALTQIQDVGMSFFANGLLPTIRALVGENKFKLERFDLDGRVSAEMATVGGMAKALDKFFSATGFKRADRLGKETLMNAAYNKYSKMAQTKEGVNKLRKRFGHVFGDEFDLLVTDLRSGKISDNVDYMVSAELLNWQPVAVSELPLFYQKYPEFRTLYTLKSFTVKQLDVVRREIIDEFREGNNLDATRKLFSYLTVVGLSGAGVQEVKDFITRGDSIKAEDIPEQMASSILRQVALSKFLLTNYVGEGRPMAAIGELVFSPFLLFDSLGSDVAKMVTGDFDPAKAKSVAMIPVGGKLYQDLILGGREEKRRKDMRENPL